jgi:hypothetical protein
MTKTGKQIWKEIINKLMDNDIHFNIINNVLTCKNFGDEVKGLWFWLGEVRLAFNNDTTCGEMDCIDGIEIEGEEVSFQINPNRSI